MFKLPPDLLVASVVQTVHDNTVQQIISTTRPKTSGRSGGIQKLIPDNRPSGDVQWRIKMWTATIDFTNAFDSITRRSIWNALKSCGVEHDHISLLKKIYRDQKASVQTDEESNIFDIQKGTKQGDPLSSLLFNTVLQYSLKDEIQRWQKKEGMGIYLSDQAHDCVTNMRFADDVLQFASSKNSFKNVVRLQEEY